MECVRCTPPISYGICRRLLFIYLFIFCVNNLSRWKCAEWQATKKGTQQKCNTEIVCRRRMFHVNKFDLLTPNCWCKWRNLLMRKRDAANGKKNSGGKKFSKKLVFYFHWNLKSRVTKEIKKFKRKLASFFFFLNTLSRGCCYGCRCSFIIQSPNHKEIEKKLCGLMLELTSMHWCPITSQEQTFIFLRSSSNKFMVFWFATLID